MKTKSPERHEIDQMVECHTRLERYCRKQNIFCPSRMDMMMTLQYSHEDIPMDLKRLIEFPDFDFIHDMFGLYRHINRRTLKLDNCFVPRCAIPSK